MAANIRRPNMLTTAQVIHITHMSLTANIGDKYYYCPHFIDANIEAREADVPRSQSKWAEVP